MHPPKLLLIIVSIILLCLACKDQPTTAAKNEISPSKGIPTADIKTASTPSSKAMLNYKKAKQDFDSDPNNVEHIIWYGRRTAYLGKYQDAITIYTDGIKKHPKDARLYRHRGHRYISTRNFGKAIKDLEFATTLIAGKANEVEPDGLPNAQNIPISSLHGNIWYHLGLAYYLNNELEKAYRAYLNCRNLKSNDDNTVSSTHWLYMIQRRIGNEAVAKNLLAPINSEMNIIENTSYYNLCKFYKELIPIDALPLGKGGAQDDSTLYGIANWYMYNGNKTEAKIKLAEILKGQSTSSFGYIAAEVDYARYFRE